MVDRSELKRQLEAVVYADGVSASAKLRALEVLTRLEMEERPVETPMGLPIRCSTWMSSPFSGGGGRPDDLLESPPARLGGLAGEGRDPYVSLFRVWGRLVLPRSLFLDRGRGTKGGPGGSCRPAVEAWVPVPGTRPRSGTAVAHTAGGAAKRRIRRRRRYGWARADRAEPAGAAIGRSVGRGGRARRDAVEGLRERRQGERRADLADMPAGRLAAVALILVAARAADRGLRQPPAEPEPGAEAGDRSGLARELAEALHDPQGALALVGREG